MLGARLRASQRNMELMTPHLHLRLRLQPQQTHGFSLATRTCLAADKASMTLIEPSATKLSSQRLPQSRPNIDWQQLQLHIS
ncbi:hypothetical protein IG631_20978 [Alternaria alternata]|nr:hypothetical protein IG631_20978 [Alternaria alternata]